MDGRAVIKVRAGRVADAKGYRACVDAVARERVHIALVVAPPLAASRRWIRSLLRQKCAFFVALDGRRIVGWCDAPPRDLPGFGHTVGLGMGLLPEARRRGIGSRLVRKVIAHCRRRGIEKIELQVFASNFPARALYRKLGFRQEGRRVRARKLDGKYDDVILMGKLL